MRAKLNKYYFYVLRVAWSRLGKDITTYRKNSLRKKNQYVKSERTDDICIKKWIKKYDNVYYTNEINNKYLKKRRGCIWDRPETGFEYSE